MTEVTDGAQADKRMTPASSADIEEESRLVADALAAAEGEWASRRTDVTVSNRLRRPLIVCASSLSAEEAGMAEATLAAVRHVAASVKTADGDPCTYYIELRSAEGELLGRAVSTDERWLLELSDPPADAEDLLGWLDAAYGPASGQEEDWFARIAGIELMGSRLVVSTDLDQAMPSDLDAAQTIIDAVRTSGLGFATNVTVLFEDGEWEWGAVLDGRDPFSPQSQ
jgi:hypothetical protein